MRSRGISLISRFTMPELSGPLMAAAVVRAIGRSAAERGWIVAMTGRGPWDASGTARRDAAVVARRDAVAILVPGEAVTSIALPVDKPLRFQLVTRVTRVDVRVVAFGFLTVPLFE